MKIISFFLAMICSSNFLLSGQAEEKTYKDGKMDNTEIFNIDFYNFTYPGFDNIFWDTNWLSNQKSYDNELIPDFTLVDGTFFRQWQGSHPDDKYHTGPILVDTVYSDFNKDGILDVLVQIQYYARTASYKYEYLAYIYSINDNKPHLLNKFGEIPGVFSENNSITTMDRWELTVENNKIYVSDDLWTKGVGRCCTIYRIVFEGEFNNYNEIKWSLSIKDRKSGNPVRASDVIKIEAGWYLVE